MQKSEKNQILYAAKKNCCNWISNVCIGGVFFRNGNSFHMYVDKNLAGKPCVAHKGCQFFKQIVIPGIKDEYINI